MMFSRSLIFLFNKRKFFYKSIKHLKTMSIYRMYKLSMQLKAADFKSDLTKFNIHKDVNILTIQGGK